MEGAGAKMGRECMGMEKDWHKRKGERKRWSSDIGASYLKALTLC